MQQALLESVYTTVLTALILTIFEVLFTYLVVFPSIENGMASVYDVDVAYSPRTPSEKILVDELKASVRALSYGEKRMREKINMHSKIFCAMLVLVLSCAVVLVGRQDISKFVPTLHAILGVSVLVGFQYFFFKLNTGKLSRKFKFASPQEILSRELNKNCDNVIEDVTKP